MTGASRLPVRHPTSHGVEGKLSSQSGAYWAPGWKQHGTGLRARGQPEKATLLSGAPAGNVKCGAPSRSANYGYAPLPAKSRDSNVLSNTLGPRPLAVRTSPRGRGSTEELFERTGESGLGAVTDRFGNLRK
jgi:hypothetical protein